jgi:arabinose-5-phosphate isomerase
MTTIIGEQGELAGIFTDGDLRRALDDRIDINHTTIDQLMTTGAKTATSNMLAAEALHIMEENEISSLVVLDDGHMAGVIHLVDLLHAGLA